MNVYKLNEITDSKLLYDKNPPRFMVYIIFAVLALVISGLIWSCYSIKTYVVKGQGIITASDKAYIMSKISGEIKEVYIEEGKEVKAGDVLVVFNSPDSKYQLEQIDGQIEIYNKRIELLKRAESEVTIGKNTFKKGDPVEAEFFNKLENSYLKADEYKVDEDELRKQGYTEAQLKQLREQLKSKKDQAYYETSIAFINERTQLEMERNKLENQKVSLSNSTEEYMVCAAADGKIHMNISIKKGMVLQGGTLIGTISNENSPLIIETLLPSTERPRIHEKDEVTLSIAGLNQVEYGTIKGQVISIDSDATIDNEKGNAYFKVTIKPEKTYISDTKGKKVNLALGMLAETRVKYEKETYMKYFLYQIGIRVN